MRKPTKKKSAPRRAAPKARAAPAKRKAVAARYVIVRTVSAGVHAGVLVKRDGQEVTLKDARRIWRWYGANTLNEIALRGVSDKSKVSEPVSEILLTQAIEVIPAAAEGEANLRAAKWAA